MAERAKRRGGSALSSIQVMFAMILGLGLLLAINFSTRITESQPLQDEYEQIVNEIAGLESEQQDLIALRDYVRSDPYVEQWARDNGKMVRPNEVLIIPVPSGETVEPTPTPSFNVEVQTAPPTPEAWELWWALFFDQPVPNS